MKFVFEVLIAINHIEQITEDVPKAAWGFRRRAEHVAHVPGDSGGVPKTLSDVIGGSEDVPNMSSAKEDH
ncbi:unnamed protein product [Heligmosomoides polygyrus]|uniref:Uncharacterized protein n=1 Tax=Heligmosomoides polygyrus TaxID=6339 RepID=A0A183F9W5_HELPZ|nr:unnamed protein product [Heligmosomoides polygyrus]